MIYQLPLAIQRNDEVTFENFCWKVNPIVQQQLQTMFMHPFDSLPLYLSGHRGSGKSHLLQATCQAMSEHYITRYLPLRMLAEYGPEVLEGAEEHDWIAMDDIDAVAGSAVWEEALFHLYNKIRDKGRTALIMSGVTPPMQSPIALADLRSRLSWGLTLQLHELSDEDKASVLQETARKRGFDLPMSVSRFMIQRYSRNLHDLHAMLNRLDEASLVAKRKITIPFVKEVLS